MKRKIYNKELKETIYFRKTSADTGGEYTELEISLEPKGGNPLHFHKSYTELFTAVKGRLGMELLGEMIIILRPGESYLVKKGKYTAFLIRIMSQLRSPTGLNRAQQAWRIHYAFYAVWPETGCIQKGIFRGILCIWRSALK